jgi:glucuronate isomerase
VEGESISGIQADKAMNVDSAAGFNTYLAALEKAADVSISSFADFLSAVKKRHEYFVANHCCVSDHGLEEIYAEDYTDNEITAIFSKIRSGMNCLWKKTGNSNRPMLVNFAEWDHEAGFVQQYHLGALRNNNSRMLQKLGPDTGWDSIGDFAQGRSLRIFEYAR